MTAPTRRTRARRGEGDLLRADLLRAAEDLLVEAGDASGVTLRGVAQRVGVTTPSVYLHFADKAALVDAVCLSVWDELGRRMDAAAAGAPDPFEALRRRGMAYVRFGMDHPVQYRVLMMQPPPPGGPAAAGAEAEAARDCFAHVLEAVAACVGVGVFHGDPKPLALSLWAAAHGAVSLLISKPDFPWPADLDAFVDGCIRMAGMGLAVMSRVPSEHHTHDPRRLAGQLDGLVAHLHTDREGDLA